MTSSSVLHVKEEETFRISSTKLLLMEEKSSKKTWGNDSIFGWSEQYSSSSDLSTPFGSELGSTETDETDESDDDEDFIAELTRQMADYMLKDDEEEEEEKHVSVDSNDFEVPNYAPKITQPCGYDGNWSSGEICYYNQESLSTYVKPKPESADEDRSLYGGIYNGDYLMRPIEVYRLKNQPSIVKQRTSNSGGKQVKGMTAQQQVQLRDVHHMQSTAAATVTKKKTTGGVYGHGTGKLHRHPHLLQTRPGMRAVFLSDGSSGTGVFMPRSFPTTTTERPKKKSGSSTVLIPARVLLALQLHFNHMDYLSQSISCAVSPTHLPEKDAENETADLVSKENLHSEDQIRHGSLINDEEMQLPQEWTY